MKCRNTSVLAMSVALSCAAGLAHSAEIAVRVPDTAAARSAAGLISRAEHAIRRYADACESAVAQDPWEVVTRDARIEYTLEDPVPISALRPARFSRVARPPQLQRHSPGCSGYTRRASKMSFSFNTMCRTPARTRCRSSRSRLSKCAAIASTGCAISGRRRRPSSLRCGAGLSRSSAPVCPDTKAASQSNAPAHTLQPPRVWVTATASAR